LVVLGANNPFAGIPESRTSIFDNISTLNFMEIALLSPHFNAVSLEFHQV